MAEAVDDGLQRRTRQFVEQARQDQRDAPVTREVFELSFNGGGPLAAEAVQGDDCPILCKLGHVGAPGSDNSPPDPPDRIPSEQYFAGAGARAATKD